MPFVYIEKVLDLWVQLMKNGGKNKSVAFIILISIYMSSVSICVVFVYLFISVGKITDPLNLLCNRYADKSSTKHLLLYL